METVDVNVIESFICDRRIAVMLSTWWIDRMINDLRRQVAREYRRQRLLRIFLLNFFVLLFFLSIIQILFKQRNPSRNMDKSSKLSYLRID